MQAIATLTLPTLNANIIDNGALKGDTSYIWKVGAIMLAVTFIQVVFAIAATFYGARSAMGFGRDVRRDLFHTVMGYSAREVGQFGAPSLITRITNDVTQVQVFVLMTLTLFVTAPIMIIGGVFFAVREDGALSLILRRRHPDPAPERGAGRDPHAPAVHQDAGPHRPREPGAPRADQRDARSCARSCANPTRRCASARPTPTSPRRR